jgi:hypothetical protein
MASIPITTQDQRDFLEDFADYFLLLSRKDAEAESAAQRLANKQAVRDTLGDKIRRRLVEKFGGPGGAADLALEAQLEDVALIRDEETGDILTFATNADADAL